MYGVVVSVWLEKCQKIWGWESVSIVVSFLPCLLLFGDSVPVPVCPFIFLKMFFFVLVSWRGKYGCVTVAYNLYRATPRHVYKYILR